MKKKLTLSPFLIALLITACASEKRAKEHVEKEIKEVRINEETSVSDFIRESINTNEKLTSEQKSKLLLLHENTYKETLAIKEELDKIRIVLIQTALEPKMNSREYNVLRKRINQLEKKRLNITFRAISDARDIIEPDRDDEKREFYRAFLHRHLIDY